MAGGLSVTVASISDAFKVDFALRHGLDAGRLLSDRAYKEHRAAMADDYALTKAARPGYAVQSLLGLLGHHGSSCDVLIVTGIREPEVRGWLGNPLLMVVCGGGD